jgi:protein-tyrosine phosphatase
MSGFDDIFWIAGDPPPGLAIVLRPRGGDWLEDELLRFKRSGVDTLVSMLEADEAAELGLAEEGALARQAGIEYVPFPIPDRHVPGDKKVFRVFVSGLADRLRQGERIAVHCRGSIGRATVVAASVLIHSGWKPAAALEAIEDARGCPVPDTPEQREWILHFPQSEARP